MRLRTTLFGLLVVVAIVLSGTVYAGFSLHKGDIVTEERKSLNATAESIAENLDTRIEEKRTIVKLAAINPHVSPTGPDSHPDAAVRRFVEHTSFDGASVIDDEGTMVAIHARNLSDNRRRELIDGNFSHRTYVRRALAGFTHVGEPVQAESGNHVVTISTPIDRDGETVGVFTATLHLERTSIFTDLSRTLEPGRSLQITNADHVLYRSADSDDNALVATRLTEGFDWAVTVRQDRSSVENDLLVATTAQFGAVGVAILSIAVLGVWISRSTLGNIRGLIRGLNRLEDGHYGHSVGLGPTDEWQRITSQFNSLAETLEQRESQLRVLNRVLRHNLRNDMSVIIAHSETLLEDGLDRSETDGGRDDGNGASGSEANSEMADVDVRSKVETIRQTAYNLIQTSEHARAIYEDLLSDENLDRKPVDLVDVVEMEAELLREDFPKCTIETHLPDRAWVLDSETVPIVVNELCRNALVHNDRPEPERKVLIEVEPADDDGDVRLRVRDNGPGLPEVESELLTGERQETTIEHGSGLGLWVVNWLVAQLGGDVSLRTASSGGSTVTVRLPETVQPDA